MTRYIVKPEEHGFVVIDRETGSVVTAIQSRSEAHVSVWELNGRKGAMPRALSGSSEAEAKDD